MAEKQTRGKFLGTGATALGGAALASVWGAPVAAAAAAASTAAPPDDDGFVPEPFGPQPFEGSFFLFQLEDADSGWVLDVEDGQTTADVVEEKLGPGTLYAKKHIGNVKYNEFSVQLAVGSNAPVAKWIQNSFDRNYTRKSGSVVAADFDYKAQRTANFHDALITEITFPALDATAKDPAYMTLKLRPGTIDMKKGTGSNLTNPPDATRKTAFKMEIEGLTSSAVAKIDAFTVKQSVADDGSVSLDLPNLSIWLDPAQADSWVAWYDDFLIAGNNGQDKERDGSLIYLDPTRQKQLAELSFQNLGVVRMTPEQIDTASGRVKRFNVELYCEKMTFDLSDASG